MRENGGDAKMTFSEFKYWIDKTIENKSNIKTVSIKKNKKLRKNMKS
jgi:hypothetical protein